MVWMAMGALFILELAASIEERSSVEENSVRKIKLN